MNNLTLIGNLTKDPELRYTQSGKANCIFSIAVAQYKKDDEWISDFFNCVVWGKLAENAAGSLGKGDKVILSGKIYVEEWNDKDTGKKRQITKVKVDGLGPELSFATCKVSRNDKAKPKRSEPEEDEFADEDVPF